MWGQFCQRGNLSSYEFTNNYNSFLRHINDPKVEVESWQILTETCVELRSINAENTSIDPEFISEITGVFTTADARLRLYDFISWIDPSQLIYCDTDSCKFFYDEENPLHKQFNNEAIDLPKSVKFGSGLGQWKYELESEEYITEIVIGGAKSYSYKLNTGKVVVKQKGITLDEANSAVVNFDSLKNMVLNDGVIKSESRYQFQWDRSTKEIRTGYIARSIHSTLNSKRVLDGYDTTPILKLHK